MFRYLPFAALILWATGSNAAIQNSDFWFHDEGDSVFIDGTRGAPLHIDYIGAPLTKPLTVRVTPDNPILKVTPSTCTFNKKDDDCKLTVQLKNQRQKVYGINHFTVTEHDGSQGALKAQAASETGSIGFGVGVQGKDMPQPISVMLSQTAGNTGAPARVVIINATPETRIYKLAISDQASWVHWLENEIVLPPKSLCYADTDIATGKEKENLPFSYAPSFSMKLGSYVKDVTNASDPIYNGAYQTGERNISSCSAKNSNCASDKWASWVTGLANTGATDMEGGIRAGQIEILRDNSWGSGAYIYYKGSWDSNPLVLLQIQGSTDGLGFDTAAATPSILQIQTAPPCSSYITPINYTVRLKIFGPGKITMPPGAQCQAFNIPPESFTNCTGIGSRNSWYEMTAVPEAGKTFAGWGSDGLCDDTKTTCRFSLTRDVGMRPGFY